MENNETYWERELTYLYSINKTAPGEEYKNRVENFVRYLTMQINNAVLDGRYDVAKQIEEIKNETLYLDYCNNFLTVERFAEHYHIWIELAQSIIDEQRKAYNENSK